MKWPLSFLFMALSLAVSGASAQDSWNVEYQGALPGHIYDVAVSGDHAFCAAGSGLMVLDTADLAHPTQVAFVAARAAGAIEMAGPLGYVIMPGDQYLNPAEIRIYDLSVPEAPNRLGTIEGTVNPTDLAVSGDYAYVTDSRYGVRVIDVSEPASPAAIGFLAMPNSPLVGLDIDGSHAYVADQYQGLRILNISNPSDPVQIAAIDPDTYTYDVRVHAGYAYLACNPGLRVLNVTNPGTPVEVGACGLPETAAHIAIAGRYAYISHFASVSVVDLLDPAAPVLLGTIPIHGRSNTVAIADGTVYLAAGFGGLQMYRPGGPSLLEPIGSFSVLGEVQNVRIRDHWVYLTGGCLVSDEFRKDRWIGDAALYVVDIADRTIPVESGYLGFGNAIDVAIRDSLAVVSDYNGRVGVMSISDPSAPAILSTPLVPYRARDIAFEGRYAYVVDWDYGVTILDVIEPHAPLEVGHCDFGSSDVEVRGNRLYAADEYAGLRIFDVTDPGAPVLLGSYDPPNWAEGLAVSGDLVYITNGMLGICIVDASDPSMPVEIGRLDTPGYAVNVVVEQGIAYVADSEGGVRMIDVRNPSAPAEIGYYITTQPASSVSVSGRDIAVGCGDGGLVILRGVLPAEAGNLAGGLSLAPRVAPNPFTDRTRIGFTLAAEDHVLLQIYSASGRRVATLIDRAMARGPHVVTWNCRDEQGRPVPAGSYFYRLQTSARDASGRTRDMTGRMIAVR
jgi:hypothetical protein